MDTSSENRLFLIKKLGISSFIFLIAFCLLGFSPSKAGQEGELITEDTLEGNIISPGFTIIQGNSFLPSSGPLLVKEIEIEREITVVVTGYSSSPQETDDTPYLTASGTWVKDGIVATNILPFGTKIRLPEIYENKIFVVEDRMNSRKGYHVDIWFSDRWQALDFGIRNTYIEVIEEA